MINCKKRVALLLNIFFWFIVILLFLFFDHDFTICFDPKFSAYNIIVLFFLYRNFQLKIIIRYKNNNEQLTVIATDTISTKLASISLLIKLYSHFQTSNVMPLYIVYPKIFSHYEEIFYAITKRVKLVSLRLIVIVNFIFVFSIYWTFFFYIPPININVQSEIQHYNLIK